MDRIFPIVVRKGKIVERIVTMQKYSFAHIVLFYLYSVTMYIQVVNAKVRAFVQCKAFFTYKAI